MSTQVKLVHAVDVQLGLDVWPQLKKGVPVSMMFEEVKTQVRIVLDDELRQLIKTHMEPDEPEEEET